MKKKASPVARQSDSRPAPEPAETQFDSAATEIVQAGGTGVGAAPAPPSVEELIGTPVGFAEIVLGLSLYRWQCEVLAWYRDPRKQTLGALVTPNGAGKSSGVVAALALWWVCRYPNGKVVITSKDGKQIDQQIYPALVRHREKFPDAQWVTSPYIEITFPTKLNRSRREAKILAFTTNDAGRAEGHHPFDPSESWQFGETGPVLIIVDEAKSVENPIFEAIDRCTYAGLLYVSSPGTCEGQFFDACTKHAASGVFRHRKVSLKECPHIPAAKIERFALKYGIESQLYRSSIDGEFMLDGDIPMIFQPRVVTRCVNDPPAAKRGARTAFCDFAAGRDENVLAIRDGNTVEIVERWQEKDTMLAAARFVMAFKRENLSPEQVFGDEGGLGKGVCDNFRRMGWDINRVNNGAAAYDSFAYTDRGSEMWHDTAAAMGRGEIRLLNADDELQDQLKSRRSIQKMSGQSAAEPKDKMKLRGLPSPDLGDAVCGAWSCGEYNAFETPQKRIFDEWHQQFGEDEIGYPVGADVGS